MSLVLSSGVRDEGGFCDDARGRDGSNGALDRVMVRKLGNSPGYSVGIMSQAHWSASYSEIRYSQHGNRRGPAGGSANEQTIVHAATNPLKHSRQIDVECTRRLVSRARAAGVSYLSASPIVGVDRILYPYDERELGVEELIVDSQTPRSIRARTENAKTRLTAYI
jgi:hypothetical protein